MPNKKKKIMLKKDDAYNINFYRCIFQSILHPALTKDMVLPFAADECEPIIGNEAEFTDGSFWILRYTELVNP